MSAVIQEGWTYRNLRGDLRGPMRLVPETRRLGLRDYFLDQYGTPFFADGIQCGHAFKSTGNIDLASGTEAQRTTTAQTGVVHDGPTGEAGDAQ